MACAPLIGGSPAWALQPLAPGVTPSAAEGFPLTHACGERRLPGYQQSPSWSHNNPKRRHRGPPGACKPSVPGGPSGLDGTHNYTSCKIGFRIKPTCPILTNSAWRASSFFRADLGDSGRTSLKDRLFSMFWKRERSYELQKWLWHLIL